MRSEAPRRTDLTYAFVNNDALRSKLAGAEDEALTCSGLDVQIRCKRCKWTSDPFAYDAWVFRGIADLHFNYLKKARTYRCKHATR